MPTLHTITTFALVSLGLSLLPGPSVFFLISQGALHGRDRALASVAGIETASAIRVLTTAAGLSALLATSAVALSMVRWAGVAYLVLLGLRAARETRRDRIAHPPPEDAPLPSSLAAARRGLLVGLGNVKMALFYLAFLPQFIHPGRGPEIEQILILGGLLWVIGLGGDLAYASASSRAGDWVRSRPRVRHAQAPTEAIGYLALAGWTALNG